MVPKALPNISVERAKKDLEQQKYFDPSNRDVEVDKIPFRPSLEAKLTQLVHNICLHEIKLCSEAAKEFVKVLKGESGSNLLRLYFHHSPNFAELVEAWKLRHDQKQGLSYIFKLINTILSHPEGKARSTHIGRALDGFARLIFSTKLDEIYKALNSNEGKQQNAALLLLASIVRRGPGLASEVAKNFNFKGLAKLGEVKTLGLRKAAKHSTRRAFVAFAISFLEVGRPRLLGSVIQQKEMYFKVLQGLGKDDEDTVASVLSTLNDKILVKESLVSPALRSVLFGDATLEQLASISAREDYGIVNELAHHVLLKVCTDPCNGLMPDANRNFRGNSDRLLKLMKKLRAVEFRYHLDLLLAIVRRRPSFASAFLDIFPYNVENLASPSWVSSISLAANLVSSVRTSRSLDFLNPDQSTATPSAGLNIQTIMKCICPRPFSRSLITKGMLHSDFLVKHGTLRLLLETLRLLDSFVTAWKLCLSHNSSTEQIQTSLERDVMAEVRSFFPDSQVLLTVLKPLGGTETLSRKRKAVLDSGLVDRKKRFKRSEKVVLEEEAGDIIIAGVTSSKDIFLAEDPVDAQMTDQDDAEKEYLGIVSDIWGSEFCSKPIDSVEEADMCFHTKLLEVLKIYVRSVPNGVEGSFDFFMKLLSSPSGYPAEFQRALLSLLNEYISWTPKSQIEKVPQKVPPLMYKHLHVFVNLLLFSSDNEVRDLAKNLAMVAMSSTGAFDQNPSEIGAWFLFLPGPGKIKPPLKVQESMPSVVIPFLCNAVRTVGKNLFEQQYWDIIKSSLSHFKGVSIGYSPLIVCVLQNCVKLISESIKHSLAEKTEISLYVCTTLKYILQTQVDSRPLSCLVQSVLSKEFDGSKDFLCEWRPLRILLLFSKSWSDKKPFIRTPGLLPDTAFVSTLDEIKGLVRSGSSDQDAFAGIVKAFSSALICATPESISKNIDSVMAVSWDLYGASFSVLQSISFLNESFLSPELFVPSPERNLHEGIVCSEIDFADRSSITEEIKSKIAFFRFSEQMPFPVLLNTIMRMDISCLPEFPTMSELLLLKVLQPKNDIIELDIQLIVNWILQIRSSYKVQPAPVLCQLSEICLRLMKHLYSQISEQDPVSSCKLLVHRVVCHPVVIALFESPLDCGTLPQLQSVSETSLTAGRLVISEIDQHILDLLVLTCEHLLFDERRIVQKGDLKSIIAIKELVERLLLVFRGKFELCFGSQSYAPLLQPSRLIHALLRFISPVKLLYLVHSMLCKFDEEQLASPNSSMILSLGLDIASGAFEMLMLYSHQPAAKRGVYDLLWEFEESNYDSHLLEEVYSLACRFSTSFGLVSADTCLLKVVAGIFRGKHSVHTLNVTISRIVGRTPKDLIIHCLNHVSMTRAKILFYLVESSPLHLSLFGHFFFSKQQNDLALTDDQFIMLLPAVLSYIASVIAKLEKPCSRCLDITSVYSNILVNGFLQWPTFLSGCVFEEKYEEILLSTVEEDIESMFKASHLGRAVHMFQYHFSLTESPTKTDDLLKVFYAMYPRSSAGKEMLDYEINEVDIQSLDDMFNVAIRVVTKVELSRICLFPEIFKLEASSCVNTESLLNALVNCWQSVVKRSDGSFKGKQDKCWSLCKSLENFILTSILKFLEAMCEELVHLDSLLFLERLMKSVLLYRFEDSETLKILREIFSLLSRGNYSYASYIQLLISHSQFTPTIRALSSHTGDIFRPISSILEHFIISSLTSVEVGGCHLEAPGQLEIVKLVRVLLSKCGKDSGINLKELHFLVLCSYGATLSEIDLELHKLMHEIELLDDEHMLDVAETDYLWGKSALKMREGLIFSQDASDSSGEADIMEDLRQSLFKENLCVDPKICALTVLYFPYQHTAELSDNPHLYDDPISEKCSAVIERYDPAFILRFSIHSLLMGYIEPVEFASLGLLAVAFVSVSSADLGMRKLGYKMLEIYLDALEGCRENKETVKRLGLLLMYVQNGVKKQWQRIPTVYSVFAAEASLILLDSSQEHFVPIIEHLKSVSTPKGIPLFHKFFCTSGYRSQRLWELRLLYLGLKSEDDAEIYKDGKNAVLERVMSFFSSPLTDNETRGLILKVVRKSVKFHNMAEHLVKNCGLFSWCSSLISMFTTTLTEDEDSHLIVVLEVITDALASRSVADWLQEEALEGLMEISSRLHRLLGAGFVSIKENGSSVDLILQILSATLKMSRERTMNKPHFTITAEGIFQLFEAVANCNSTQVKAIAERGLDPILSCTPQIDIICMDMDKLRRFLIWGTSTALKSDLKKGSKPSESRDTKTLTEEAQDETMVAKFVRWLLASVILGKLYSKANDSDPTVLSEAEPETLLTLLEYCKKQNLGGSMKNSERVIGEVIVHLQTLMCTNYRALLPSVVCALSLMLLRNGLGTAGTESEEDYKLIKSLCCRISSPHEASLDWRWSYDQVWMDPSSGPATDLEKIDLLHACQHLVLIFSDMLGEMPRESKQVLLSESFDLSSVFEWEISLVKT